MSALYGKVTGDRGKRTSGTRCADRYVDTWVQTEFGRVAIFLTKDGSFEVTLEPVSGRQTTGAYKVLASGNVNDQTAQPGAGLLDQMYAKCKSA